VVPNADQRIAFRLIAADAPCWDIVRVDDEAIDSALGIVPNSSLEIDNLAFAQVETCYVIFVHEQGHACTVNSPKAVAIRINRDAMS
jgi:hypothetical protein